MHPGDALDGSDLSTNGFGNLKRGRAQRFGEGKEGDGKVSEFDFPRLLDDYAWQGCVRIAAAKKLHDAPR